MTNKYEYTAIADGIGIVSIDYSIDDRVVFRDIYKPEKLHHAKINYGNVPYFNYRGRRFHLNNFIRTNL